MKKLLLLMLVLCTGVGTVSADDYKLHGSWDYGNDATFSDGVTTVTLAANTTYEFKFYTGSTWYGCNSTMYWYSSSNYTFYTGDANGNCKIVSANAGTYTFTLVGTSLTVTYPVFDEVVYFYNNLGWSQPYAYILGSSYWDNSLGAGSYGRPNGIAMEQIAGTNIWKAEYPSSVSSAFIAFVKDQKDNAGNFYQTQAVYRGDYTTSSPLFVPNTTSNGTYNETPYYSNGEWHSYPTYTRTVTSGNYGTICLPFAATITGADVYTIASTVGSGDGLTGINLASVANNETAAGVAYIFQATSSTLTATFSGNYTDLAADNGMVGTYTNTTAPVGSYVIGNDNKIHKVIDGGSGVNVGKYKGYITLTGISSAAPAPNFIPFFNSETTGITSVNHDCNATLSKRETITNNHCFNLAGQRVTQPTKGLYIVNGKKIMIK